MNWLYGLQRKYSHIAVRNLMMYIVIGQVAVYFADLMFGGGIIGALSFSRALIFKGQVWRLVSFLLVPELTSLFSLLITSYLYYIIGYALEDRWGSFIFNVFYLVGVVCAIAAGLITGYAVNFYLNMSLFFAFAILYPDYQLMLFFILPVKMKILALIDALLFLYQFITGNWSTRALIIASIVNIAIFFTKSLVERIKRERSYRETRQNFRRETERWNRPF